MGGEQNRREEKKREKCVCGGVDDERMRGQDRLDYKID